ncbi:BQ2448_7359 [Microbotryum intermedium]|uniref:BQ2448_7359 protein n=1 Tax=Microbotryum intermedium TaxID=269621 RepID=A0A238FN49_9BASI|nr:BQ2448_7359 [Microbotryum intermedium]
MPPRVFLLRHGEALHNVLPENHSIPDPVLTRKGELQALSVPSAYSNFFASLSLSSALIVTSPFRRTMQTTMSAFASVLAPVSSTPIPLVILPQVQECGDQPCDTGGELSQVQAMFPQEWLDWSECTEGWNSNQGFYQATEEKQLERAKMIWLTKDLWSLGRPSKWVRRWIRSRTEDNVVLVSHHGFLRRITKIPAYDDCGVRAAWANVELREYGFKDETGQDEEADVVRIPNSLL